MVHVKAPKTSMMAAPKIRGFKPHTPKAPRAKEPRIPKANSNANPLGNLGMSSPTLPSI